MSKHTEDQFRVIMANIRQEHLDTYFAGRTQDEVKMYITSREKLVSAWSDADPGLWTNSELVCEVLRMFHQGVVLACVFRNPWSPLRFSSFTERDRTGLYSLLPQETREDYDVILTYISQGGSLPLVSKRLLNEQLLRELKHLSEHIEIVSREFADALTDRLGQQKTRHGLWPRDVPTIDFPEVCSLDLWEKYPKPQRVLQVDLSRQIFRTLAGEAFPPERLQDLEDYKCVKYVLPNGRTVYSRTEFPKRKGKRKGLARSLRRSIGSRLKEETRKKRRL